MVRDAPVTARVEPRAALLRVLGMRRSFAAAATVCVALLAAGSAVAVAAPAGTHPAQRSPASPTIVIKDFGFTGDLTVRPGVTVKVINKDSFTHTLTDKKTHKWDTGEIAPSGGSATFTAPSKVGRYPFGCKIHPEMKATLVVAIPADPSALTAPRSATIVKGMTTRVRTTLTDTKTHNRIVHATVRLLARPGKQGAFHRVGTFTTNANGVVKTRIGPSRTSQYKWRFAGSSGHRAVTSGVGTVTVHA
jgi:plastocyanin